jgi:hypothetical protein
MMWNRTPHTHRHKLQLYLGVHVPYFWLKKRNFEVLIKSERRLDVYYFKVLYQCAKYQFKTTYILGHTKMTNLVNFGGFKIYTLHYFRSGYCHIYTAKDIWNFKLKFYTSIEYIIAYILIFFKIYWNFKILFSIFFQRKSYIEFGLQKSAHA